MTGFQHKYNTFMCGRFSGTKTAYNRDNDAVRIYTNYYIT